MPVMSIRLLDSTVRFAEEESKSSVRDTFWLLLWEKGAFYTKGQSQKNGTRTVNGQTSYL